MRVGKHTERAPCVFYLLDRTLKKDYAKKALCSLAPKRLFKFKNFMVSFSCSFSDPQTYDGSLPSTKTESWQYNKETCTYNSSIYAPTTTIASSTDIQVYGSFTAGELIMAFLMFCLIVIELGKIIANGLEKINTKRTFIRYRDADTEITNDII